MTAGGRRAGSAAAAAAVTVLLASCAASAPAARPVANAPAGTPASATAAATPVAPTPPVTPPPTPPVTPPATPTPTPTRVSAAPTPAAAAAATAQRTAPASPAPVRLPFPVPVVVGNATQVVTVRASGSWATVVAWQRDASGWHRVLSTAAARVGANGVTNGATRRQGTNTTPTGTYPLTQAFGILADPGARLPYHRVGPDDWWVEDNNSRWYNTLRQASAGGFDTSLPESDVNGSEHLIRHPGQYDYAVVIDYNMHPAVPYRGAGIFLHVSDGYPTAGCVAVPTATLVAILRWLDPGAHPRIAIG